MSSIFAIEYIYANGEKLTVTNKSFTESVKMVLNGTFIKRGTPIKVFFPSTKKVLYFDDDYFRQYIQGNLDQQELIELTECDGLYRNKIEIETKKFPEVEQGSLWKKQNNHFILIDKDDYIEVPDEDMRLFEEV
jgi:hypothetical protein